MVTNSKAVSSFKKVTSKFFVAAGLSLAVGFTAPWQGEVDHVDLAVALLLE